MNQDAAFHILTVGWDYALVRDLCNPVAVRSGYRFSHVLHPRDTMQRRPDDPPQPGIHFFRENLRAPMPAPDQRLLSSLERDDVPTIHNMILGDPIVSRLRYADALAYATFLATRLADLFDEIRPAAILSGFDALHCSLALAVARRMGIPCFALHFSVIPHGLACLCDRMSPAGRIVVSRRPDGELESLAEKWLQMFEQRKVQAAAYIAPPPLSATGHILRLPARARAFWRTLRNAPRQHSLQFTEGRAAYSVGAALRYLWRARRARRAISGIPCQSLPPRGPYVLFGLHMQPESSIDVWAPFFSNQMWVIELLARSIPPSHKLLVKIHKSDIANHSREQLDRMGSLPGVELVQPFADTRLLIEGADLVVAIQGTMGLEAALLGRPVIMLGDSPVAAFPSAARIGEISDLPMLIRRKLAESPPERSAIVRAYASYLTPYMRASSNDWRQQRTGEELDGYVELFRALAEYLAPRDRSPAGLA